MFWSLSIGIWDLPAQLNCLEGPFGIGHSAIFITNIVVQLIELFNRVNNLVFEI